jgi:hypothetical protein
MLSWITKSRLRTAFAILFFVFLFLCSFGFAFLTLTAKSAPLTPQATDFTPYIALITAIGSVVGTISTIILAWRADKRSAKENEFKVVQMQQQILELERKLKAGPESTPRIIIPN